jgi:hypothetical protein
MDMRSLARPAADLLTQARCSKLLPLTSIRGHKTTARTKRALKVAPHDSFLPGRSKPMPTAGGQDHIIYNPPSSEASPFHTPFLFLPPNDPRRAALVRMRISNPGLLPGDDAAAVKSEEDLPPSLRYKRRLAKYNLTETDLAEMKRLRKEDPLQWSVRALAAKFECSPIIVQIAAPAPEDHKQWLEQKMDRQKARWGPIKTQAREDRRRRAEMLYRGDL